MSLVNTVQEYMAKIVSVPGMKALLLDEETTGHVSMVYSQSDVIAKEVFLIERVDAQAQEKPGEKAENMHHLKAVCFLRPTAENIDQIKRHLARPKFKEYHLFFSNILPAEHLAALAEADQMELIRQVQEFFVDYSVCDRNVFSLNLPKSRGLYQSSGYWLRNERNLFDRNVQGLVSLLLSHKVRPTIRYPRNSEVCRMLAQELTGKMKEEADLFHSQQSGSEYLLLLVDRRDDPVTPLLQQWTYQAMVHELLGLEKNRVDMRSVPGIRKDLREVVMDPKQDKFYRGSMFLNFGDLGVSIKEMVMDYQRQTKNNAKLDSIEDMQNFVDKYPEFRALSTNVSKHIAVMTELSRLVDARHLMEVSEIEQELACTQDHSTALERVLRSLDDRKLTFECKLRLAALYALRYETKRNQIPQVLRQLRESVTGLGDDQLQRKRLSQIRFVETLLETAGHKNRGGDLFGNKTLLARATKLFNTGLKGVENIYTQHRAVLTSTLDTLLKGKLKTDGWPFANGDMGGNARNTKFRTVMVFILGGATYEEAAQVQELNEQYEAQGTRIILGGSTIHNSKSFIADILDSE